MVRHISRRSFLILVTGAAGALAASCRPVDTDSAAIPTLVPDGFAPTPEPDAAGAAARSTPADFSQPDPAHSELLLDQETAITPLEHFYVQHWRTTPAPIDPANWTLTIHGLVDRPLTVTYADIMRTERISVMRTLECIGNPVGGGLIGNTTWTGFQLKPLLEEAGIKPEAVRAKFSSADEYRTAVDLEWILQPDTLLVYEMDGQPLPHEHGFPLRILMPGLYGQKMPKWLTGIELVAERYLGYWETNGWSDIAEVKTNSQIVLPANLTALSGSFALQGWAYAGRRAITAVEVSIDDGPWQPCELLPGPSPLAWTQWWTIWTPRRSGAFTAAVRATDEDGFTQSRPGQLLESAYPDGTDAIHSVAYHAQAPDGS